MGEAVMKMNPDTEAGSTLKKKCREMLRVYNEISELTETLKALKADAMPYFKDLADAHGKQSYSVGVGSGSVSYAMSNEIKPVDGWAKVKDALGPDAENYLREVIEIKPDTKKIKSLLGDGDYVRAEELRSSLTLTQKETITISPN